MNLNDYSYGQVNIGFKFGFKRVISQDDVKAFAGLTGDNNPLHTDLEYAKTTQFNRNIVHGMLASSLFSTLLGMICPGKRNLFLSQTLKFIKPVFPGEEIEVRGTITDKNDSIKVISIKTEILQKDAVAISGEAKVKVLGE